MHRRWYAMKDVREMISVIVPAYNAADYIGTCLESVLRQRYTDLELIVVNDGSKDRTEEICGRFAKRDPRVRILSCPHRGVSAARNEGVRMAKGAYLFFLDSDDAIHHGLLWVLYRTARRTKAEVTACGSRKIESASFRKIRAQAEKKELGRDCILMENEEAVRNLIYVKRRGELFMIGGKLIRKDAAEMTEFDEKLIAGEDTKYMYQILVNGGRVAALRAKGYFYRIRKDSAHGDQSIRTWKSRCRCERYLRDQEEKRGNEDHAARKEYAIFRSISEQYMFGRIAGDKAMAGDAAAVRKAERKGRMYRRMGLWGKVKSHLAFHCYPIYYFYYILYRMFCRAAGL